MKTTLTHAFALVTTLSLGISAGCSDSSGFDAYTSDELGAEDAVAETEQAIASPAPTTPTLVEGALYQLQIQEPTNPENPAAKCVDFAGTGLVTLGQPLVRRTCSSQPLGNNNNTQAFYFTKAYPQDPAKQNFYFMKPAHAVTTDGALCVYSSGPSLENGGNLVAGQCTSHKSRIVEVKAYVDNAKVDANGNPLPWYHFVTLDMEHSQRCLTVVGSWDSDWTAITQYGTTSTTVPYCTGLYPNQRIRILDANGVQVIQ